MYYRQILIMFIFILAYSQAHTQLLAGPNQVSAHIASWKNNATAAYSIIHDDACGAGNYGIHTNADSIAYNRGLVIGAGFIVQNCLDLVSTTDSLIWTSLKKMVKHGHEIISHSWLHDDAIMGGWQVEKDVIKSKVTLEQHVPECTVTFFVFPYDQYNDQTLDQLRQNGYLGARAGVSPHMDRGVNVNFESFDPMRCNFDAFCLTDTASIYASQSGNANTLRAYLDDAIAKGGWALQEMHEVGDGTLWGYIRVPEYTQHMDYVQSKTLAGVVWNATPTNVAKYIVTKDRCGAVSVVNNILRFSSPDSVPQAYRAKLTVLITTPQDIGVFTASQTGTAVLVKKTAPCTFLLNVNPCNGEVKLDIPSGITLNNLIAQRPQLLRMDRNLLTLLLPQGEYTVSLHNLSGRRVMQLAKGRVAIGMKAVRIIVPVAPGYYLLAVRADGVEALRPLVVLH